MADEAPFHIYDNRRHDYVVLHRSECVHRSGRRTPNALRPTARPRSAWISLNRRDAAAQVMAALGQAHREIVLCRVCRP